MKKVEIKHCTCGAEPDIRTVIRAGDKLYKTFAICEACGKKSNEWLTFSEAVADWNRRVNDERYSNSDF